MRVFRNTKPIKSMKSTASEIILATLDRINKSLDSDANALCDANPEAAYIKLVKQLLLLEQ